MHDDPMVFKLPCMGGTITVTVSGSQVTVHGARRVVVEMPLVVEDGRPRFAADSLDIGKSHETYVINTGLDADGMYVIAGRKLNNADPTSYDSPWFNVKCKDTELIVSAMRQTSEREQTGVDKTVLQKISFKKKLV